MAPTPRHGKGSNVKIDSTAGSLVNFSSGLDEATFSRALDTAEITSFGDNDKSYIPGLRGATFSVSGMFSSTHAEVLDGVFGDATSTTYSVEYSPDGSTAAGRHLLLFEVIPTSLEYAASVSERVNLSAEYIITGAVTSTNH